MLINSLQIYNILMHAIHYFAVNSAPCKMVVAELIVLSIGHFNIYVYSPLR